MTDKINTSLINPDEKQLDLIPSEMLPDEYFEETEAGGEKGLHREFTGARLFDRRPETYMAVIALTAEGLGAIRIGKLLKVSPNTVLAVREREGDCVDIEKERISRGGRNIARMCIEGLEEALSDPVQREKISAKDLAIIHGVMVEKSELLAGLPTSRTDHGKREPNADDFNEYLANMKRIAAETAIDVESMDLTGERSEQKGKLLQADAGLTEALINEPSLDTVSDADTIEPEQTETTGASDNESDNVTGSNAQGKGEVGLADILNEPDKSSDDAGQACSKERGGGGQGNAASPEGINPSTQGKFLTKGD